tara:strand:- start:356 stop:1234 length:879 start_codon:yes stop_codon:yes gene_type:complete
VNKNFGLIGVAGFITPKHLEAIFTTQNNLSISLDPHDSVGILDKFFPNTKFFKEEKNFIKELQSLNLDFISICSPNYTHYDYIKTTLSNKINCICEKPLVLKSKEIYELMALERKYTKKIFPILQLRLDPEIIKLKKIVETDKDNKFYNIDLKYVTLRGDWYSKSWKGNDELSGGLLMNIGIHFFDILCWIFGEVINYKVHKKNNCSYSGSLLFKNSRVSWLLSVDREDLPSGHDSNVYKVMSINDTKLSFTNKNLHNEMYKKILNGDGFTLRDSLPSIELVEKLKNRIQCL